MSPFAYVFYDIPDDNVRLKVSNALKDYGLRRLQKSVFVGELSYNRGQELALVIDRIMGDADGDVRIVFVPPSFLDKVIVVREMYGVDVEGVIIR